MISTMQEIVRVKKNPLLLLALLLLINVAMLGAINNYLLPENSSLQMKWGELRRKVAVDGRMDINALYKQGKADLDKLQERIPLKRQFPAMLGEMLETADSNNVTTGNISYKPDAVKGQNLLAYTLSMNVGGSYAGIKSFLSDIMEMKELVVIDKLAITQSDQTSERVIMSLQMTIYIKEAP